MKKAVTIKEIAEALGLSRNTVSKALNGQPVPEKTRELVLRKASELNYKSINAEVLHGKKYRILLLSGKPLHNIEFYVPVIQSVENYCYDHHYELFQFTYNASASSKEAIVHHIREMNVDGILGIECFDSEFINTLEELGVPLSFIDFPGYKFETKGRFDLVCCSDQKLVCELAKSLIQQYKIRRLCFVGDYRHCLSFHERYMGMIRALQRKDLPHSVQEDILEDDAAFDYGDVARLKERIQAFKRVPECFVCCNDFVARKVTEACKELGYFVPEDVFVFGFDGTGWAVNGSPKLTTFNVDKEFLGEEAMRSLSIRIRHPESPTKTIFLDCDVISRESTKR